MESITLNMTLFWRTLETLMLIMENLEEFFHKWRISKTSCIGKQVKWETILSFSFIQQGRIIKTYAFSLLLVCEIKGNKEQ